MRLFFYFVVLIFTMPMIQSCFTGIESTPKITAKDLREQNVTVTDESRFAASLAPEPLKDWIEGRRFMVADAKLSMLFEREPQLRAGEILEYAGYENRPTIAGDTLSSLIFNRGDQSHIRYPINLSPAQIAGGSFASLPMAVDLALVDNVRNHIRGKSYYLLTPLRVDSTMTPIANGKKYVRVNIVNVVPGNGFYPLRVDMTDADGHSASVAMTAGIDLSSTRNFDSLFSFNNPRLRYPDISDSTWRLITNSEVTNGMTTEECRLSLGSPRDVKKGQNGSSFFEQWTYDNGAYCIFTDGVLSSYRL